MAEASAMVRRCCSRVRPVRSNDVGLIMFGIAAWRGGWRITYLGQDTPIAAIEMAVDVKPVLFVSAIAEGTLIGSHTYELRMLAARVPVAVGGGVRPVELAGLGIRLLWPRRCRSYPHRLIR